MTVAPSVLSPSPHVGCKHTNAQICKTTPSHSRLPQYTEESAQEVQPQTTYSIFPGANLSVFSCNKHTSTDAGSDTQSLT